MNKLIVAALQLIIHLQFFMQFFLYKDSHLFVMSSTTRGNDQFQLPPKLILNVHNMIFYHCKKNEKKVGILEILPLLYIMWYYFWAATLRVRVRVLKIQCFNNLKKDRGLAGICNSEF